MQEIIKKIDDAIGDYADGVHWAPTFYISLLREVRDALMWKKEPAVRTFPKFEYSLGDEIKLPLPGHSFKYDYQVNPMGSATLQGDKTISDERVTSDFPKHEASIGTLKETYKGIPDDEYPPNNVVWKKTEEPETISEMFIGDGRRYFLTNKWLYVLHEGQLKPIRAAK